MSIFLRNVAIVAGLSAAIATPAFANQIVNGGFETNGAQQFPITGWSDNSGIFTAYDFDEGAHSGNYAAFFGSVGQDSGIAQTVTNPAGTALVLQFWLASDGGLTNDFNVYINGVNVFNEFDSSAGPYVEYSIPFTSTGSDLIDFEGRDDPAWLALDDVTLVGAVNTTPEPSSLVLLGTGILSAAGAARRKFRKV